MIYSFGNKISYNYTLLRPEDYDKLQVFSCGNTKLDSYFHNELITNNTVNTDDGLTYKVYNSDTGDIIGIVSLAASGIIHHQDNYIRLLPGVKIDVFAIDLHYQKIHYDEESKNSTNPDDHYYFSDDIMGTFINLIRNISDSQLLVSFILLYADINAYRFYERNGFLNFESFMEKEQNMEINKNIPMYMQL
mgnify:CR=1 FL=1